MSRAKGSPKTGGRKRGVPNKRTAIEKQQAEKIQKGALEAGLKPVDFMLKVMRDNMTPLKLRCDMALAAAPYCHPRLGQVGPHTGDTLPTESQPINILVAARQIALALYMGDKKLANRLSK